MHTKFKFLSISAFTLFMIFSAASCDKIEKVKKALADDDTTEKVDESDGKEKPVEVRVIREEVVRREAPMPSQKASGNIHMYNFDPYGPNPEAYFDLAASRKLTHNDIAGLDRHSLRILRNSIFARHGRYFNSQDLADYFFRFPWYNPRYKEVPQSHFSSIEKYNIQFIQSYE